MEELRDVSIHHTALKLTNDIKNLKCYSSIFKTVQKLAASPDVQKDDMKQTLEAAIKSHGLETQIRNAVFHLIRSSIRSENKTGNQQPKESFAYLTKANIQWERRVRKSLMAMCTELKASLHGQPRSTAEKEELLAKWDELSNYSVDLSSYRPVYAPKDLLEVLLALRGPQKELDLETHPKWEFSHIALPVRNLLELKSRFNDLLRVDKTISDGNQQFEKFLALQHAPLCQQMLKKAMTPAPYRGKLWAAVLGSQIQPHLVEHWAKLKSNVYSTDVIVDKLVFKDVQLTATNDDQYFVFEDVLYQVMLCFLRDTEIPTLLDQSGAGKSTTKIYEGPPSGVVPFHGICMFVAPFCYLFEAPIPIYFTFRAFYIRYCHRLTTINTHPQGIISMCLLFEKLLQTHEPQLWSHFRELQIQPIRIVFKWLMRAFSGHLPPDQLLILWDLILGFDTLEIVPLLAVVILSFRKDSLMQVTTIETIESVLADLSSIKILPLIQLTLARE